MSLTSAINFTSNVIKTTVGTVLALLGGASIVLYLTKPTQAMLTKDIEKYLGSDLVTKGMTWTSDFDERDYLIVKTTKVDFPDGKRVTFLGIFQNWFPWGHHEIKK